MGQRQKIGTQLVQEGLIRPEQLEGALKAQMQFRGRLGSNLVELGFLGVDEVSQALGRQLRVPAATRADFVEISPDWVKRLPARAANMYSAIPLRALGGSSKAVIVAMMDPTNLVAVDEIQAILAARVEAKVAPELRIVHLLDKLYGVKRKQRTFIRVVLDKPVRSYAEPEPAPRAEAHLSPPPPPPAVSHQPRGRGSRQPPGRGSRTGGRLPDAPHSQPAPPASKGLPAIESMSLEPPPLPKSPREHEAMVAAEPTGRATETRGNRPSPPVDPRVALEKALEQIGRATKRDEVADALVAYLGRFYACALVLIVKGDMALGWKGRAGEVPIEVLESIVIPLNTPSVFQQAVETGAPVRRVPPEEGERLHGRLWKLLRSAPDHEVVAAPVVLGKRTVNLIYGHPAPNTSLAVTAENDLGKVASAAAAAYERLIRNRQS